MTPPDSDKPTVVFVTKNQNKIEELSPLFKEFDVDFIQSALEKHEIRSDEVKDIAREAAIRAYSEVGSPVVVDDTGLHISALNGFPRSYPAFVLTTIGLVGILKLMKNEENRDAFFTTAVGYCDSEGPRTFVGHMHGTISELEIGTAGFGYDPIFIPKGYSKTYAQLSFSEKIQVSHRTKAFREFLKWYTESKLR
jgi:XTP/dITP diphosphohydrolase